MRQTHDTACDRALPFVIIVLSPGGENPYRFLIPGTNPKMIDRQTLFIVFAVKSGLMTLDQVKEALLAADFTPGQPLADRLERAGLVTREQRKRIEAQIESELSECTDDGETMASVIGDSGEAAEESLGLDDMATDRIGKVQPGRYLFKRVHDRGGQATIMLALDRHIGREVAIKQLLPDNRGDGGSSPSSNTSKGVVRFLREARVTGQLEHPNIVPVHELGQHDDGSLYYAMRLVRGETLAQKHPGLC